MTPPRDDPDRLRDLVEGGGDPDRERALRDALAGDPDAAAAEEEMRAVFALTGEALPPVPPCRTTFDQVLARTGAGGTGRASRRLLRLPVAVAAAAVLALAAGAAILVPGWLPPPTVVLKAIALAEPAAAAEAPPVPARLASWRPVEGDRVAWLDSLEEGREVAAAAGRPVLLFLYHPQCPLCISMDRNAFRDPGVRERMESFVPVHLNVMELGPDTRALLQAGYPYFGALGADGKPVAEFPGFWEPDAMARNLDAARTKAAPRPPALEWDEIEEAARLLRQSGAPGSGGGGAAAWRELERVAARDPDGLLGRAAAAGLDRLRAGARAALLDARLRWKTDPSGAESALEKAAAHFAGTPAGVDLAAVLDALRGSRRFPHLEEEHP